MCEQGQIPSRTSLGQIGEQLYAGTIKPDEDFEVPVLDSSRASVVGTSYMIIIMYLNIVIISYYILLLLHYNTYR